MAKEFVPGMDVADVYAAALFDLAREANTVDDVFGELTSLVELVESDPQIAAFFQSGAVDDDDRAQSLEKIFRGRLSDIVLNTLQVMNAHGRLGLLHPLRRSFQLRIEDARGQIEVVATSAIELDSTQRAEIERVAEQLSGKQPLVQYVVDPDVLGGLVLQVGDYRYDNSLRRHLHVARMQLLERSSRGLGIGAADGDPLSGAGPTSSGDEQA